MEDEVHCCKQGLADFTDGKLAKEKVADPGWVDFVDLSIGTNSAFLLRDNLVEFFHNILNGFLILKFLLSFVSCELFADSLLVDVVSVVLELIIIEYLGLFFFLFVG